MLKRVQFVEVHCLMFLLMPVCEFQLTSSMSEIGLNIQEAHAFSTIDGYSLDVFAVDGWEREVLLFIFIWKISVMNIFHQI